MLEYFNMSMHAVKNNYIITRELRYLAIHIIEYASRACSCTWLRNVKAINMNIQMKLWMQLMAACMKNIYRYWNNNNTCIHFILLLSENKHIMKIVVARLHVHVLFFGVKMRTCYILSVLHLYIFVHYLAGIIQVSLLKISLL